LTPPGTGPGRPCSRKSWSPRLKLTATDPGHLGKSPGQPLYRPRRRSFSRIGNDANTVDIDREMMKLSQNQLLYSASAEIITRKLDELRNVIGGIR
jgi:flagellar basal-body rod protein FlgB